MSSETDKTAEELLAQVDWLQGLARSLLVDRDLAEDATQDACLIALERPPASWDAPRAWLATVLRRLSTRTQRRLQLRTSAERSASRAEALPSAVAVAEELSIHRWLVDAVRRLDEPYRTAVVLRYFHGLSPREIAHRGGTAPGTVRSRISRGLERIRVDLDRRGGGGREIWCTALMTLLVAPASRAESASAAVMGAYVMKKLAMVGVALLVLFIGATLVQNLGDSQEEDLVSHSIEQAESAEGEARRRSDASDLEAEVGKPAETSEPASSSLSPLIDKPERGFLVRCIDSSGAAIEGAWVAVAQGEEISRLASLVEFSAWRGGNGPARRTDARGEVRVQGDKRAAFVAATSPADLYGNWSRSRLVRESPDYRTERAGKTRGFDVENRGRSSAWEDDTLTVEITLERYESIAVRTVDPDGAALGGIPLQWRSVEPGADLREELPAALSPSTSRWRSARSDPETGVAVIRRPIGVPEKAVAVRAMILARVRPLLRFTPSLESQGPVSLELPYLGSLTARVEDRQGLSLQFLRLEASVAESEVSQDVFSTSRAEFDQVEIGTSLLLESWSLGGRIEETVAGPAAAGQRVEASLRATDDGVIVVGRLVDERGQALVDQRFIFTAVRPLGPGQNAKSRWCRFKTDTDARFRVDLDVFGKTPPTGSRVRLQGVASSDLSHRRIDDLAAECILTSASADQVIDLGDVELSLLPILVSGRVVDADGQGLPGAVVQVEPDIKAAGDDLPVFVSRDRGRSVTNYGPLTVSVAPKGWEAFGSVDFQVARVVSSPPTDRQGRFVVRWSGLKDIEPTVRVRGFKLGRVQVEETTVAAGAEDVVVRMRKGFLVVGRLAGIRDASRVKVELVIHEEKGGSFELPVDENKCFGTERRLAVGAALRVLVRPTGEELCRRSIEIPEGESDKVDLGTIDLSSQLTQVMIAAVDPDGERDRGISPRSSAGKTPMTVGSRWGDRRQADRCSSVSRRARLRP